jgi:hypothetical protein
VRAPHGARELESVTLEFPESILVADLLNLFETSRLTVDVNGLRIREESLMLMAHLPGHVCVLISRLHYRIKEGDEITASIENVTGIAITAQGPIDIHAALSIRGELELNPSNAAAAAPNTTPEATA